MTTRRSHTGWLAGVMLMNVSVGCAAAGDSAVEKLLGPAPQQAPAWLDFIGTDGFHWKGGHDDPQIIAGRVRACPREMHDLLLGPDFPIDVTDQHPSGIPPIVGKFSGEVRIFDLNGTCQGQDFTSRVLALNDAGFDLLPIIPGPRDRDSYLRITDNSAVWWKDAVYSLVKYYNTGKHAARPLRHWEIGNEPNHPKWFNPMGYDWEHAPNQWVYANLPEVADIYAEDFLAPTIEAIRQASQDVYGDPRAIKIVTGGIVGPNYKPAREWIERALNHRIEGRTAPTLKGKQAWEVVDIIGVHEMMARAAAWPPDRDSWQEGLTRYYNTWISTGTIEGLWSTEECGLMGEGKGMDGGVTMMTAFRYLDWWSRHGWEPGKGLMSWWGLRYRPLAMKIQSDVVEFLGPGNTLLNYTDLAQASGEGDIEIRAFAPKDSQPRLAIMVSSPLACDGLGSFGNNPRAYTLKQIAIPLAGDASSLKARVSVKRVEPTGVTEIQSENVSEPFALRLLMNESVPDQASTVFVVFVSFDSGKNESAVNAWTVY